MTSLGIRRRLLFAVTGIVAAALVATIAAFNVLARILAEADLIGMAAIAVANIGTESSNFHITGAT